MTQQAKWIHLPWMVWHDGWNGNGICTEDGDFVIVQPDVAQLKSDMRHIVDLHNATLPVSALAGTASMDVQP
jgi:hypothetical protein